MHSEKLRFLLRTTSFSLLIILLLSIPAANLDFKEGLAAFGVFATEVPLLSAVVTHDQSRRRENDRTTIKWPSRECRTLQCAIDAAPNGGRVEILSGVHFLLDQQIFVRGKTLEIAGESSGLKRDRPITHLVGPPPRQVKDEDGNLLLPADAVTGLFNFIGADVVLRDVMIEGSDAAAVTRNDEEGNPGRTLIQDVVIAGAGRGILLLGSGPTTIKDVVVQKTFWHGISLSTLLPTSLLLVDVQILAPFCAGIFFEKKTPANFVTFVNASNVTITGASCGGIVGFNVTGVQINDSHLVQNHLAGILLFGVGQGNIGDNTIADTQHGSISHPALKVCVGISNCGGDGIALLDSGHSSAFNVEGNTIHNSARAGFSAWGSTASLKDNTLTCSAFDVNPEIYQGVPAILTDAGGNQCGCGGPLSTCIAVSSNLVPPPFLEP